MTASATESTEQTNLETETIRIVVLDNIANEGLEILESTAGVEYEVHTGLSGDTLRETLNRFDGAVCRSGVKITPESLQGNQRLRGITRAGVGTDNIDKPAATRLGIVVMNTPTGNTVSTAEHTIALMLGLSRNVAPAHASLIEGKWDRKKFSGKQLHGKTLGIVGLGRIGQEVASRAAAFGMNIIGFDPYLSRQKADQLGITTFDSVEAMLPEVDYLTVHTPLTDETHGLIGKEQIAKLKPGARLINCARGGIYNEADLVEGLRSGQLGGVALDVYQEEPCTDSPLFGMPGVLCTPHLGASTEEAQIQVAVEAVELLINYLKNGEIRHAVNTIAMDPATLQRLRGYLNVAHRLGILLADWHGGAIESVKLKIQGEISNEDHRILKAAFFAGLLARAAEHVTVVNAEALAVDRGIQLTTETTAEHGAFASVVSAEVSGSGKVRTASGTLFGRNMPRVVELDGYHTDAFMDGEMLIFQHRDIPGVIGFVGSVLADEQINIAQMAVGRNDSEDGSDAGDETAIGVLNLDAAASEQSISRIFEFEGMSSVQPISLPPRNQLPTWLS